MIGSNLIYKVVCPNCRKGFSVKLNKSVDKKTMSFPCKFCNFKITLHQNALLRKWMEVINIILPLKSRKFIWVCFAILVVGCVIFIWLYEFFHEGRIWVPLIH